MTIRKWAPALVLALSLAFYGVTIKGGDFGFWGGLGLLTGERQDLGAVNFAALTRRPNFDDALACPPDYCKSAALDIAAPILNMSAEELDARLRAYLARAPRSKLSLTPQNEWRRRIVLYEGIWRFPDVIDIEIAPIDADHVTLAIYARSAFGFGASARNQQHLLDLLGALGMRATMTG